ncbi:MAG: glycosyl hydrolase [Anaerolineae bacterium]
MRTCPLFLLAALCVLGLPTGCGRSCAARPQGAGVVAARAASAEDLSRLGVHWYYTYDYTGEALAGFQRVRLVRPHEDIDALRGVARAARGSWWIVGNEPNDPNQDNLSPVAYAAWYHRVTRILQAADPSARLVPAGIANADPTWAAAFLTAYREAYGCRPPADAWNVHVYILEPDRDPADVAEFRRRIVAFREWMAEVGEADTPLWLTEFGVLYGSGEGGRPVVTPARLQAYIAETVAWLEGTEYVQAYAWFANDTHGRFYGDLFEGAGQLTECGEAYRRTVVEGARKR